MPSQWKKLKQSGCSLRVVRFFQSDASLERLGGVGNDVHQSRLLLG
jgi:hypothetical protein